MDKKWYLPPLKASLSLLTWPPQLSFSNKHLNWTLKPTLRWLTWGDSTLSIRTDLNALDRQPELNLKVELESKQQRRDGWLWLRLRLRLRLWGEVKWNRRGGEWRQQSLELNWTRQRQVKLAELMRLELERKREPVCCSCCCCAVVRCWPAFSFFPSLSLCLTLSYPLSFHRVAQRREICV